MNWGRCRNKTRRLGENAGPHDEVRPPEAISPASPRTREERKEEMKRKVPGSTANQVNGRSEASGKEKDAENCFVRGLFGPKGLMDVSLKWMSKLLS